ncbi:hypothetical protein L208DRAFT_402288 [Tricholoma matsutake]|nr:hypothetical protein L208DRAFT_402288 [Tricholoma matsutake 945]
MKVVGLIKPPSEVIPFRHVLGSTRTWMQNSIEPPALLPFIQLSWSLAKNTEGWALLWNWHTGCSDQSLNVTRLRPSGLTLDSGT